MNYLFSILFQLPLTGTFKGLKLFTKRDKISNRSKLKVLADNKYYMTQIGKIVSDRTENIVGKGKNAGYPQCF